MRTLQDDLHALEALRAFKAAVLAQVTPRADARSLLLNWQAVLDYLQASLAHDRVEQVRLLHLNTRNRLILDEQVSCGTIDRAELHVREVLDRALELGSAALIIAHNHPGGDPTPTRADVEITRAIIDAGKPFGIAIHDHLIISSTGHVSMRARGLI